MQQAIDLLQSKGGYIDVIEEHAEESFLIKILEILR
jgi:hypothetical protein